MTTPPPSAALGTAQLTVGDAFSQMRMRRSHLIAGAVLFMTFVVEAWEQVGLVYVSDQLSTDFHVGMAQVGTALGAVALGMVPGTLLWMLVIERIGRKRVSIISLLAYSAFALASILVPTFSLFVLMRFLSGVAFGGVYAVTFPYFMEMLPTRWRGPGAVGLSIGFPVGTLLCIGTSHFLGGHGWRIVALVAALAGLWAIAVWRFVPESPYWLVKRGRIDEARRVIAQFGIGLPAGTALVLDDDSTQVEVDSVARMRIAPLLTMVLVTAFTFSWAYWALQSWLPVLLQDKGLGLSDSLGFVALSQLVAVPGYLLAAWATGRFGRRSVFVVFVIASVIGTLIFATADGTTQLYIGNFTLAFFSLGAWGIWNTWSGEVLPTRIRGVGYAASTAAILLAQSIAVPVIGLLMDHGVSTLLTIGSIAVFMVVALLSSIGLPETEGKALR